MPLSFILSRTRFVLPKSKKMISCFLYFPQGSWVPRIYYSHNNNNRNNDNYYNDPHHGAQVGEYLERMARYDLMLGVTSAEAFVLLNQEVFSIYIWKRCFCLSPTSSSLGLIMSKTEDNNNCENVPASRRWSWAWRPREGTNLCRISSRPPFRFLSPTSLPWSSWSSLKTF